MRKNIKFINNNYWFTLVEVIVAVTIMSIIMISVMFIFINSSQLSMKIDINRSLQENSKNIIETISEDLRKNWLRECTDWIIKWCLSDNYIATWSELWIWDNHYYLAKKNLSIGEYIKINDMSECDQKQCFILKNGQILSNSYVSINNLEFSIINQHITKIQLNLVLRPSSWKWVNQNLIKNNELNIQTTLSESYIWK